jgi:hypothetical protein
MAKSKKVERKKASKSAMDANQALCDYYQFGCDVIKMEKDKKAPDFLEHFHSIEGKTHNDIYKARSFAMLCQNDELDLEWLCKLGSKRGKRLSRCHIHRLVHAPEGERKKLAEKTAKEGWSVQRLTDEIRKMQPEHRRKGRRPPRPASVLDAMVTVEKMVRRFSRLKDALQDPVEKSKKGADVVSLNKLPKSVREPLKQVFVELENLQNLLDKEILEEQEGLSKKAKAKKKKPRK